MSKQDAVRAHYEQRGLAASGDAYNSAMRKARQEDEATRHYSAPVQTDPTLDSCFANFRAKCIGNSSDDPEEGNDSCCCTIM